MEKKIQKILFIFCYPLKDCSNYWRLKSLLILIYEMQTDLLIENGLLLTVYLHLPCLSEFFLLDGIAFFTIFVLARFLKGREVHHDCVTDHELRNMETKGHFNSSVLTTCLYMQSCFVISVLHSASLLPLFLFCH